MKSTLLGFENKLLIDQTKDILHVPHLTLGIRYHITGKDNICHQEWRLMVKVISKIEYL